MAQAAPTRKDHPTKYPLITEAARHLGTSRNSLYRALIGRYERPALVQRYREFCASHQIGVLPAYARNINITAGPFGPEMRAELESAAAGLEALRKKFPAPNARNEALESEVRGAIDTARGAIGMACQGARATLAALSHATGAGARLVEELDALISGPVTPPETLPQMVGEVVKLMAFIRFLLANGGELYQIASTPIAAPFSPLNA